ncbi:MAG TPA: HRDC domain-containing protein [Polyangiaceae bacterium]|nr:HRDC domain-containing protein [Polyangiaceae bacterium]
MADPAAPPAPGYRYVATEDEVRDALARLEAELLLGFDTETDWDATGKRQRLSLVQLTAPSGEALVVDAHAVDLALLRPFVEAPARRLVAHNAPFDATVLAAVGLRPPGLVDTLRLAREALELPAYALADVANALFGSAPDKALQRSAWRKRPLSAEQLAYAAADARWVLRVYEALKARLEAEGRWAEALARATLAPRPDEASAPKRKRAAPPPIAPPLTRDEKKVVAGLKAWRRDYSQANRTPVYLICPDRTLEALARARPKSLDELRAIYGLGEAKVQRFGAELLAALGAKGVGPPPGGSAPPAKSSPPAGSTPPAGPGAPPAGSAPPAASGAPPDGSTPPAGT